MPADQLTALCTINDHPATKRHRWEGGKWHTESYSAGQYFAWSQVDIDSIESLSRRLLAIEAKPNWFIVRGEPMRRAKYLRRVYKGDDPYFKPADRRWLCIDIDGLKAPAGVDHVEYTIARLPAYFHDVACHWQFSSSAGIKSPERVYLHLWYWLERPACDFSLREWAKSLDLPVDAIIYNPVQPHYTAAPIIEGAPDPIQKRSGLRQGAAELVLPESVVDLAAWLNAWRKKTSRDEAQRRSAARRAKMNPDAPELRERYALAALDSACQKIESAPQGKRHRTIFAQAASVAELFNYLPETLARSLLEDTARIAISGEGRAGEAVRTITEGIAHGRKTPRDLSHIGAQDAEGMPYVNDDDLDGGWLSAPAITCPKYQKTPKGCAHYADNGACKLDSEFMCIEWLKINTFTHPDNYRPPRSWWSEDV